MNITAAVVREKSGPFVLVGEPVLFQAWGRKPSWSVQRGADSPALQAQYQDQNTNFRPICTSRIGFLVVLIVP